MPILDAQKKPGWYPGWKTEFEYVVFHDEVWEVRNLKTLFNRIFERLWETKQDQVLDYSESHGGPVFKTAEMEPPVGYPAGIPLPVHGALPAVHARRDPGRPGRARHGRRACS